jgi:hypothetical protein
MSCVRRSSPDNKTQFHPVEAPPAQLRAKPAAPSEPSRVWAPPKAEDHAAQGPRSCETEPAPEGRHGSSSIESSAFRAVGYPTRRPIQRNSTACRKRAEHIQAAPARQPLCAVIIAAAAKICAGSIRAAHAISARRGFAVRQIAPRQSHRGLDSSLASGKCRIGPAFPGLVAA